MRWRRGRAAAGATAVVVCLAALVAYDARPARDVQPAWAAPVRNATIVIDAGGVRKGYATPQVSVSGGGTVTVVNLDTFDHTVTSVAKGAVGLPVFDVLNLGRANAINLGVNYHRSITSMLMMISVLVAISAALVGPVTFFGLLVASLAYSLVGTSRHKFVLPAAALLAIICLVGGQTILERVFEFDTALSIIIEFLGGIVFIMLVLRRMAR